MASRLSSLLVRDGWVGARRLEKAFQRQVVYGGSLDTILLEMSAVPEARLAQYLALASGIPPATIEEQARLEPRLAARVPQAMAESLRVVPLLVVEGVLQVLVCDPVELARIEDLADALDGPVQPLIVPEFRWHLAFAQAYQTEVAPRFANLAHTLSPEAQVAPIGRDRSIIVDEPAAPVLPAPAPVPVTTPGLEMVAATAVTPARALARELTPSILEAARRGAVPDAPAPPTESDGIPLGDIDAGDTERVRAQRDTLQGRPELITATLDAEATAPGPSPLAPREARAQLAHATSRDEVFALLLRGMRSRLHYTALLTVQGGTCVGRTALGDPSFDLDAIRTVLIPLDTGSAFRSVVTGAAPYCGPAFFDDADAAGMLSRLGGQAPASLLIVPVRIRDRVIAVAVGHRGDRPFLLRDVEDCVPLAAAVGTALEALIVRAKAPGASGPTTADVATPRRTDRMGAVQQRPSAIIATPPVPDATAAPEIALPDRETERLPPMQKRHPVMAFAPPRDDGPSVAELLAALASPNPGLVEDALLAASERAAEMLPAVAAAFPGPLKVDRYRVSGRPLRAAQYGPLLELLVRIGPPAVPQLLVQLSSPARDTRFYAAVCLAELRPPTALRGLVEALFDADYGVRACAVEALAGYNNQAFELAMRGVHDALVGADVERVAAAASAVAELADVQAVPSLLVAVSRGDARAEAARRALVTLTRQDFGTSERKWQRWFDEHGQAHRIEWLIDALGHKDGYARHFAIEDLRRITGEQHGYHHDLGKRERDGAIARWQQWWREVGRERFAQAAPDAPRTITR